LRGCGNIKYCSRQTVKKRIIVKPDDGKNGPDPLILTVKTKV